MEEVIKKVQAKLESYNASNFIINADQYLIICHITKDRFKESIADLKDNAEFSFKVLTDISACDYPDNENRFEVLYNILSLELNLRVVIKVAIADKEDIETVSDLYNAAVWYEREVWDMFGINFLNNPDMRRILTDYGFKGHPLRKDFPLTGYEEVRYDFEQKKVIYEPVSLPQEFRTFDFKSPWEGAKYALPGDEKTGNK